MPETGVDSLHLYPPFRARLIRTLDAVNAWCARNAPRFRALPVSGEQVCSGQAMSASVCFLSDGDVEPPWNLFRVFGELCESEGLTWGGSTLSGSGGERRRAANYCEWPRDEAETYARAAGWKRIAVRTR
jgi:hypothetical protein